MGAILSAFASWLITLLADVVAWGGRYLIARVILAFGISIATVSGITAGLSALEGLIQANLTGAPQWIASIFGLMGFDSFVNIIFSAFLAKLTLKGLTQGGAISRLVIKGSE